MESESKKISIDLIDDPVLAMRSDINDENLGELAKSIKEHGLINPVTVRPVGDRFEVIAGHRRFAACRQIGIIMLPVTISNVDEGEAFVVRAHENLIRQAVSPVDEAMYLGRLVNERGYTREKIIQELDRSASWVDTRLAMLDYPDYILAEVATERIGLGVAKWLMKITDEATRLNWLEPAARDGINEATAERWFNQWSISVLPIQATPEAVVVASGQEPRQETAIQCAKCLNAGLAKHMHTVWVHRECPNGN